MFREIIYEKHYPRDPIFEEMEERIGNFDMHSEGVQSPIEMMEELERKTMYIPIPGREKKKKRFIQNAIQVAGLYQMDIEIVQFKGHVSATLSFDCGAAMMEFKRIMAMGDDYSFFTNIRGYDITMSVDYYTHYVIRNGRVMEP